MNTVNAVHVQEALHIKQKKLCDGKNYIKSELQK